MGGCALCSGLDRGAAAAVVCCTPQQLHSVLGCNIAHFVQHRLQQQQPSRQARRHAMQARIAAASPHACAASHTPPSMYRISLMLVPRKPLMHVPYLAPMHVPRHPHACATSPLAFSASPPRMCRITPSFMCFCPQHIASTPTNTPHAPRRCPPLLLRWRPSRSSWQPWRRSVRPSQPRRVHWTSWWPLQVCVGCV